MMNKFDSRKFHFFLILISAIGIGVLSVVFGIYAYYFKNEVVSLAPERWGQFGDFIGGTANPILSFLGLVALLVTLFLQNKELTETRRELAGAREAQESLVRYS